MKGSSPVFGRAAHTVARARSDDEERGLLLAPQEGWVSFLALAVMLVTVAIAIDDATWAGYVPGTRSAQTSFLPFGALLAVAVGLLLAKSRLSLLRAHLLAAVAGAAYLLFSTSAVISDAPALEERLHALSESTSTFIHELLVLGIRSSETSVFLLTVGALLWSAGQFAAFAVFRRQRPLPAIAISALPLLINVSLTIRDQYVHVVVFTAATLLLLVRLNLWQQVRGWRARAIGEGAQVSGTFLRSGAAFIALALVGSVTLAANTSSAPLSTAWRQFDEELIEVGYDINRWMGGVSGAAKGPSILFAPSQTIRDVWESSDAIEFTATTSDTTARRWRGATYDVFDGRTWQQSARETQVVPPGEDVMAPSAESVKELHGRQEVLVEVIPDEIGGHVFVSPDGPYALSEAAEVQVHAEGDGETGGFIAGRLISGMVQGKPYTVRAFVPMVEGEEAITGNQLAAAGVSYPAWVKRYTEIREGSIGKVTYATAAHIASRLKPEKRDPYHIALAMQEYLRSSRFIYRTDVRGYCVGENLVDCFLSPGKRQGYCEYFATAMVMMLRTQGIPARYALGYLPGKLRLDGIWEVPRSAAHAWVEVYFPGYGWITFDPTPGNTENTNSPTDLAEGEPIGTPRPSDVPPPTPSFGEGELLPEFRPPQFESGSGREGGAGGAGPLAGIVIVLFIAALLLVLGVTQLRRLPRTEPELAYRGVTRIASRFGHGPRPTQTAYEFADGLAEVVPSVRSELRVVATAKVETTYGARQLPGERLQALREAYARVRLGLLRLLFPVRARRRPLASDE